MHRETRKGILLILLVDQRLLLFGQRRVLQRLPILRVEVLREVILLNRGDVRRLYLLRFYFGNVDVLEEGMVHYFEVVFLAGAYPLCPVFLE